MIIGTVYRLIPSEPTSYCITDIPIAMDYADLPGFVRSNKDCIGDSSSISPPSKRPRFEVPRLHFSSDRVGSDILIRDGDAEPLSTDGDAESVSMDCDAEPVSMDGDAEPVSMDGDGDGDSFDSEERARPETYDRYESECANARAAVKDIDKFLERVDEAYNLRNEETAKGTDFFEALETYRKEVLESKHYFLNLRDSDYVAWTHHEEMNGWIFELECVISQAYDIMEECGSLLERAPSLREGMRCIPEPCENGVSPLQSLLKSVSMYWSV